MATALLPAPPPQRGGTARTPAAASRPRPAGYAARYAGVPVPGQAFPDGTVCERCWTGGWMGCQVQAEAVRFNVLARAAGRPSLAKRRLLWSFLPAGDVTSERRLRGQASLRSLR